MNPGGVKTRFDRTEEQIAGHHAQIRHFSEGVVIWDYCETAAV